MDIHEERKRAQDRPLRLLTDGEVEALDDVSQHAGIFRPQIAAPLMALGALAAREMQNR